MRFGERFLFDLETTYVKESEMIERHSCKRRKLWFLQREKPRAYYFWRTTAALYSYQMVARRHTNGRITFRRSIVTHHNFFNYLWRYFQDVSSSQSERSTGISLSLTLHKTIRVLYLGHVPTCGWRAPASPKQLSWPAVCALPPLARSHSSATKKFWQAAAKAL